MSENEQLILPGIIDGDALVDEVEDDQEEAFLEIAKTIGEEFDKELTKRADMGTWNYLLTYGLPRTPRELRAIFQQAPIILVVWAINRGYIALTEKGLATAEEHAKNEEHAAALRRESAFEEAPELDGMVIQGNFGQYL